jgi:hypothetical protein
MRLEAQVRFEDAMKDPENLCPKFKPDLKISQETVVGRSYQSGEQGFNTFLKEMEHWKIKREKKIREK